MARQFLSTSIRGPSELQVRELCSCMLMRGCTLQTCSSCTRRANDSNPTQCGIQHKASPYGAIATSGDSLLRPLRTLGDRVVVPELRLLDVAAGNVTTVQRARRHNNVLCISRIFDCGPCCRRARSRKLGEPLFKKSAPDSAVHRAPRRTLRMGRDMLLISSNRNL